MTTTTSLESVAIMVDPRLQQRAESELDEAILKEYREIYENGASSSLLPIVVFHDRNTNVKWLADG